MGWTRFNTSHGPPKLGLFTLKYGRKDSCERAGVREVYVESTMWRDGRTIKASIYAYTYGPSLR